MTTLKAHLIEHNLKKQTQFLKRQIDAKSVITIVYGDLDKWRRPENKANQTQSAVFGWKY